MRKTVVELVAMLPPEDRRAYDTNHTATWPALEELHEAAMGKCLDCGHSVNTHDNHDNGENPARVAPRTGVCRTCGCDWMVADPVGVNLA